MLVAPLRQRPHHKQAPQDGLAGALPHEDLPFWLVRWLLFRLMFASGVVKLTSRCPAWWGLTGEGPVLEVGAVSRGLPSPDPSLTTCSAHLPLRDPVPAHTCLLVHPPSACLVAQTMRGGNLPHRDRGAPSLLRPCSPPALGSFLLPGGWGPQPSGRQDVAFFSTAPRVPLGPGGYCKHSGRLGVQRDRLTQDVKACLRGRAAASLEDASEVSRGRCSRAAGSMLSLGFVQGVGSQGRYEQEAEDSGVRTYQRPRGDEEGMGRLQERPGHGVHRGRLRRTRRGWASGALSADLRQVLLQVLIIITGNYNFFNLLTLVLTTALLDDGHLTAASGHSRCRKTAACECQLVPDRHPQPSHPPASFFPSSTPQVTPALVPPHPTCLAQQPGPGRCWLCCLCSWNLPSTGC